MNTLKTKFWGIRFLRIVLKSQHCLIGVVLQNRQETDLLIPEQGASWVILNDTCCFLVNTSSQVKVSQSSRKTFRPYRISKNELESSWGGYNLSLGNIPGDGNLALANAPTSPCYAILMLLMIAPCIINCLTCFVSDQVNKLQHAVQFNKDIKLQPTAKISHTLRWTPL